MSNHYIASCIDKLYICFLRVEIVSNAVCFFNRSHCFVEVIVRFYEAHLNTLGRRMKYAFMQ